MSDPIVEEATVQKNIFDQIKYAWEQAQWADKLATLHHTLTTVRENLEIAIRVKNAIGDPSQIVGLLDDALLDGALSESGIIQTFQELGGLVAGAEFDKLTIEGSLQLDGTLDVVLTDGFQPQWG